MKKFLGYFLSPIAIIAFLLILCIFQPIQWLCFNLGGYKAHKKSVDILNFFLTSTAYILFNRIIFINRQNLPVGRSIIFVANHQSLFDIPALIWFLRKYHAKFISKVELTKGIPSISYNLKHGGGANINRKDARQSITELIKFAERMRDNKWSAVIFPEGTRSKIGKVKQFQSAGIATILKKCPDALIVPIAIKDSWKMIQYGFYPMNTFTPITWEVLEPIEPTTGTAVELVLAAENRIKEKLGQV
ncbi:MAG: lysophospholipid acyltransferase family protein [Mucilaginibacter sp.]